MFRTIFKSTLEECGVKLSTDEAVPHVLTQEHPLVRRELQTKLCDEDIRPHFIQQMKEYLQNDETFTHAITKTSLRKRSWKTEKMHKSLMNILLTIDQLQAVAMPILLEKLPHKILNKENEFVTNTLQSISQVNHKNEEALAQSLLDNMDVAEMDLKLAILHYFPTILSSISEQSAQHMLTLVEENDILAEATIECLNVAQYSSEVEMSILIFIYNRLLTSRRYYKIFPRILDLLLNKHDDKAQILEKTRITMDKIMSSDLADVKLVLHKILITWTGPSRQFYAAILKANTPEVTKPIDIYLLLLLCQSDKLKYKTIEAVIKRKVKGRNFSADLWDALFDKYFIIESIEYLHTAIFNVAISLIESHTPANAIFGNTGMLIFKKLFAHEHSDENVKIMMITEVQNILKFHKSKNIEIYLKMLLEMSKAQMFEPYCDNLMNFLNLSLILSPKNMKYVFEIVCENVVRNSKFVEHLRQDISKLFMVDYDLLTKKGVIGAVMLAKYQALATGGTTSTLNDSVASDSNDPHHQAISLLDFAKDMCDKNASSLGLFYDELSMSLSVNTSDKVLCHLHYDIQNIFQNIYVAEEAQDKDLRVPLKVQFDLNNPDEVEQSIYINIGELVQTRSAARTKILILPATFRFLRTITGFRCEGKMEAIDALLGCGVMLPNIEDIDTFGQADLPIVANCLFHCINWFRELVSAFVVQGNALRLKVIQRLGHIIMLEDKLDETMALIPDHKLPESYFYDEQEGPRSVSTAGTSGIKRPRYDASINVTELSGISGKKQYKKRYYNFREMDSGVMGLLKYPVVSEQITTSQAQSLRSKQFQFILRDSIGKLASIMNLRPRAETLHEITAVNLLRGMEKLMRYIHKQFRLVARELYTLIENEEDEISPDLKVSFDLVINLYKLIFSWPGYHRQENQELLQKFLKYFHDAENSSMGTQTQTQRTQQLTQARGTQLDTSTTSVTSTSTNEMKRIFIENMSNYKTQCLVLSSAAALLELLITLKGHMIYQRQDADKIIVQTAKVFLKKSWLSLSGAPEQGKEANDSIRLIITAYLDTASIRTLSGIVNTLTLEIKELKTKKDSLQSFGAVNKSNIHIMIKCLCNALHSKLKSELATQLPVDQLTIWQNVTHTLQKLIDVALVLGSNNNLLTLANTTLLIINLFIKCGFTTIEKFLKKKPDEVQALFTTWEKITRFLHRLMCEVINKRMKAFLTIVPTVRAALEKFVLSVKSVMVSFECTVAFFEGALLNKNLDGEQILTQTTNTDDDDDDDEGAGEEDDIFTADTESMASLGQQSASEIFE